MPIRPRIAVLLLALPLFPGAALAQLPPSPDAPPVSTAPAQPDDDQSVATFKLQVNLVDMFFTVKGKNGELIPHLTKSDCSVMEDKQPQTWKTFTAESDLPLTLGILLDTSGSQYYVLPLEQQAGGQFLEQVMRKKDEAFLLSFDVNVDLLQDFTNNAHELARAMDKAQINTAGGNGGSGIPGLGGGTVPIQGTPKGTLLYDAIYQAAREKMTQETGRKAMIILTDGEDEGSEMKIQDAIAAAQRSNVIVYVILIADPREYWNSGMGYYGLLRRQEDLRRERRARHQRGQQRQEASGRLSADRGRAANSIRRDLYAHRQQARRHLPPRRGELRRRHACAGAQGVLCARAGTIERPVNE